MYSLEIHPCIALDENNNITDYQGARAFEQCDDDDKDIACWSIYIRAEDPRNGENPLDCVGDFKSEVEAMEIKAKLEKLSAPVMGSFDRNGDVID